MRVAVSQEKSHGIPELKHNGPLHRPSRPIQRLPDTSFHNNCACGGGCPRCQQQSNYSVARATDCAAPAPAGAAEMLAGRKAHSLSDSLRVEAEHKFGVPLTGTRIHVGPEAHRMTRAVRARAFTLGRDIVFGAGQYTPESAGRNPLLWHELGHVAAPPASPGVALRALLYDDTPWTLAPLAPGHTAKSLGDQLDKKKTKIPPDITGWHVKGAPAGSEAEIFLEYSILALARPDRWDRVMKFDTEIGWLHKGLAQTGQIALTIDEKGDATAELVQSGFLTRVVPYNEADAIAKLTGADFGLASVEKGDKAWSVDDLNDVVMAFSLLPSGDRTALKGVALVRVTTLPRNRAGQFSEGGGIATGATKVTARPELRLADGAFASGRRFVGTAGQILPASYQTIAHEAGHAVEMQVERLANEALGKAIIQQNVSFQAEQAARARWKAAYDKGLPVAAHKAEVEKQVAKNKAAIALAGVKSTALAKTQVAASLVKPLETDAQTKQAAAAAAVISADSAAKGFLATELMESDPYRASVTAVAKLLDAYAKDSLPGSGKSLDDLDDAVVLAVKARDAERTSLAAKFSSNPALTTYEPVDKAQDAALDAARTLAHTRGRTLRLQNFVDVVKANKITPFTQYARDNWPYKPEEFYAEAYSLWLADPTFVKLNYKPIFDFFDTGAYLK
jgi:uncharacterized protein DUF4157